MWITFYSATWYTIIVYTNSNMYSCSSHESSVLTGDFVAGVFSVVATFYYTSTPKNEQFGMQIKLPKENFALLQQIARYLNLRCQPKIYGKTALLNTRSRIEITDRVIPFCDGSLYGQKMKQYIQWKQKFLTVYATLEKNA